MPWHVKALGMVPPFGKLEVVTESFCGAPKAEVAIVSTAPSKESVCLIFIVSPK
jgi:hypothetical protein